MSIPRQRKIVHILFIPRDPSRFPLQDQHGGRPVRAQKVGDTWRLFTEGEALVLVWDGEAMEPSLDWLYRKMWQSYIVDNMGEDPDDIARLVEGDEAGLYGYGIILRE